MTLVWNREQRTALKDLRRRWQLPGPYTATYAASEIEIAKRDAARERVRRRQRLARQLTIAFGWSVLLCMLVACASSPPRPDTIYRPRSQGAIDLSMNKYARHCSELTNTFSDAYNLEASMKTVLSISVADDASRMILRTDNGRAASSQIIGDASRLRGFWYYGDWTLAVALDHGSCTDGTCAAEVFLIKYNGAKSPIERPTKLCFEKWVGAFKRVPREVRNTP